MSFISHYSVSSVLLPSITSLFTAFVPAYTVFVIFKPFFLSSHLPHLICLLSLPLCCPVSCVSVKIDAEGTPPSCRMHELFRRHSMWKLGWTEAGRNKGFKSFHHIFAPSDNLISFGLTTKVQCVCENTTPFQSEGSTNSVPLSRTLLEAQVSAAPERLKWVGLI